MKPLDKLDIVLSIYNQEKIVADILAGIFDNTLTPFNLILIFDGCTDKTKIRALKYIHKHKPNNLIKLIKKDANNVYETKANNIGFKLAKEKYLITLQDDMLVKEIGWEKRLTYPLRKYHDVFAVTSRGAQDLLPKKGKEEKYYHTADRQLGLPRDIFAIRDVINRGPIAFDTHRLRKLNFLNEAYAPSTLDEADLCLRAWKKYKWKAGAFWIDYYSPLKWGKLRSSDSTMDETNSHIKNVKLLYKAHGKYINSGVNHSEDIKIDTLETEKEIRPFRIKRYPINTTLSYPFFTKHFKQLDKNVYKNSFDRKLEKVKRVN